MRQLGLATVPAMRLIALLLAIPFAASADTLTMPEGSAASFDRSSLPTRGWPMSSVRQRLGEPTASYGPVGEPPITRWDYDGLIVVYEYDLVITTVVPAAPAQIYNQDELQRAP